MGNIKTIKIKDLKQGDILLFSPTEDWESRLIASITKSPVSHAAMSYYDYNEIIEEIPPYAQINSIKDRIVNRKITIMRLTPFKEDMSKVLNIGKNYVANKEPYTKMDLVFVGLFILFKKSLISSTLQKLLIPLMKHIISDLIVLINKGVYKGSHPMVCSQFVYNCYEKAGREYKLIVSNENSINNLLNQVQDYINKNKDRKGLKSKLIDNMNKINEENAYNSIDKEKLLENIYYELQKEQDTNVLNELQEEFVITTHEFCTVINYLFNNEQTSLLLNCGDNLISAPIKTIIDSEEFFITPGDLLMNCKNLIKVGMLDS